MFNRQKKKNADSKSINCFVYLLIVWGIIFQYKYLRPFFLVLKGTTSMSSTSPYSKREKVVTDQWFFFGS